MDTEPAGGPLRGNGTSTAGAMSGPSTGAGGRSTGVAGVGAAGVAVGEVDRSAATASGPVGAPASGAVRGLGTSHRANGEIAPPTDDDVDAADETDPPPDPVSGSSGGVPGRVTGTGTGADGS